LDLNPSGVHTIGDIQTLSPNLKKRIFSYYRMKNSNIFYLLSGTMKLFNMMLSFKILLSKMILFLNMKIELSGIETIMFPG